MRATLALAFLTAMMSGALAQSEEETVVFMLSGLEGKEFSKPIGEGRFAVVAPREDEQFGFQLSMQAGGEKQPIIAHKFTKLSDCVYRDEVEHANGIKSPPVTGQLKPRMTLTLDFSKVHSVTVVQQGNAASVAFEGIQTTSEALPGEKCTSYLNSPKDNPRWEAVADKSRLEKAFGFYRANFCKGSAF